MMNQWALQQKVSLKLRKLRDFDNWPFHCNFNGGNLLEVQKKLHKMITKAKTDQKYKRIKSWRAMIQQGTASKNIAKEVYQWLRNKDAVKPSNHVADSEGNILFQPQDAIDEINSRWDDIFAANILSDDPHTVLRKIWPYVESHRNPIELEPIKGFQLRNQVLRRKSHAAPGLDGWRTKECQVLPTVFFDIVADFFNQVENKQRALPSILTTGKQIILDKNGSPDPLQKRLICLLPVFLLAYTGARFAQLQHWMQTTLPQNLFGAIKGRSMSSIHTSLRLQIDDAKTKQHHLCGIKIDKSKCFDRIVPQITGMLFLAFGLPAGLTTFFLQMYSNLKRHLSYLNWTSPVATTTTNGVVQGCSLSLIAINLNMAVWSLMVSRIPNVIACAFIDDAYLWVKIQHKQLLFKAIEITEQWDVLCGQALNIGKCKIWGTSNKARQDIAELFPNMKMTHIIDVLGTQIQTTETKSYGWSEQKTQKIARDIKNISALPVSQSITEHILATKVTPQLTYAPHVNQIPKKALVFLQNKIAKAIWKNKPLWRSKPLLLGLITKPFRVDPTISRAYNVILDVLQFLKTTTDANREIWINQCNAVFISPHSMCALFFQACDLLGIDIDEGVFISLWGSPFVSMLDFTRRDFKKVLQHACRQAMYKNAANSKRKDIKPPAGIIDFDSTNFGARVFKNEWNNSTPMSSFRDSVLVGCVVTNDRAAHLNDAITNKCRCCSFEVESFEHLVSQCPLLPTKVDKPAFSQECGPNFSSFGIVEVSYQDAQDRLSISVPAHLPVSHWSISETKREHLWTDGSCDFGDLFFHTVAAYAVVNANGCLKESGPVRHWSLSAYAAELYGVIVAFTSASQPITIHCDCKSLVDQVNQMMLDKFIPCMWSHLSWWHYLFQLWIFRKSFHSNPLEIIWIPAHVAESCPSELLSRDVAENFNTTVWDILNNRKADFFAKKAVDACRKHPKKAVQSLLQEVSSWQWFLAKVNIFVSESQTWPVFPENPETQDDDETFPNHFGKVFPQNVHGAHPLTVFRDLLPNWEWSPVNDDFNWSSSFEITPKGNTNAKISENDWLTAAEFFKGLSWKIGENLQTSFLELAAQAHFLGYSFEAAATPAGISTTLKKFLSVNSKAGLADQIHPGVYLKKCKSNGKTFPSGLISGAYAFVHPSALKTLAIPLLRGRDHRLSQWDCPFISF